MGRFINATIEIKAAESNTVLDTGVLIDLENVEYIQNGIEFDDEDKVINRKSTVFCMKSSDSVFAINFDFKTACGLWVDYLNEKSGVKKELKIGNSPKEK